MGWVTLHSIAALYPDNPKPEEIALIRQWIDCFARTIVCPSCQVHFTKMLEVYRGMRPNAFQSRTELMTFVVRAHNAVNRRLNKKVYSLSECQAVFAAWSPSYCVWQRNRYLRHIHQQWASQVSMQGIVALSYVKQLVTAETEYWSSRTLNWSLPDTTNTSPLLEPPTKKAPTDLAFDPIQTLSQGSPRPFKFRAPKIPFSLMSK